MNVEREATMAMPMIPALICMLWCTLYPKWLRIFSIIPSLFFAMIYTNVSLGDSHLGWTLYTGYATLQIAELLWGIYLYLDWKKMSLQQHG